MTDYEKDPKKCCPHALGIIGSTGNLLENVGIASVNHIDTGQYEVVLDNDLVGRPVVLVTPTIVTFDDPIPTYTVPFSTNNSIVVHFVNSNGQPRNAPFSILVYSDL